MSGLYSKQDPSEWWAYGRDTSNNRYTPLKQINPKTFAQLELVAQWDLPINKVPIWKFPNKQFGPNEGTPIKVGKYLYTVTAASQVAKFDLDTLAPALDSNGNPIIFDPVIYESYSVSQIGFMHRGLIYWQDEQGQHSRLFLTQGNGKLVALDLENLRPIASFGDSGVVPFHPPIADPSKPLRYGVTSPPVVCNGVVITGSAIPDLIKDSPPARGNVQAFDAISGDPLWSFNTVPSNQEMQALGLDPDEEWINNSNANAGQTNVWTLMSADEDLDLVYLPIGSANNDSYGGGRLGNNLFSQALVALEGSTGKVRWYQQLVRHGIWDYDIPAAPNLVDITVDGQVEKLVIQVTKQAFAYVYNRETGKPRWDLVEAAVPASTVPGEKAASTQPIPSKPLPFDHQGVFTEDSQDLLGRSIKANVIDFTPALNKQTKEVLGKYTYGSLYSPPVVMDEGTRGTLQVPGYIGGASWAGAVVNQSTGQLYVSSVTDPFVNAVQAQTEGDNTNYRYFVVPSKNWRIKTAENENISYSLPILSPPWGRITAIDLQSGEHSWPSARAVGRRPREDLNKAVGAENVPKGDLGWNRRTHLLATPTLLIGCQEPGRVVLGYNDAHEHTLMYSFVPEDPLHRTMNAYDPATGELLASHFVPSQAQGALISFEHQGLQYIAYPSGGYNLAAKVLLFRLPKAEEVRA